MNIEELRDYCLSIKGASECFPFDETTLVFKVMTKMFAYLSIAPKDGKFRVSIKCNPEKSIEFHEQYEGVARGYHTKSNSWISLYIESDLEDSLIKELISNSVSEVIKKLSKKKQQEYSDFI